MFEINQIHSEHHRTISSSRDTYTQRAHTTLQPTVVGYVADVDELSRLTNSYNVVVPELANTMLRRVPRTIPGAFAQANGVGYLPPPLSPGQPVMISFMLGRTSLPIISGSLFANGQYTAWQQGNIPQIDQKDSTNLSLYPTPLPPEVLAFKGNAEAKVYPLLIRTTTPTQPSTSGAALEVPGTTYVHDNQGNSYSYYAGQRIVSGQNEQKQVTGPRRSLADLPMEKALQQAQQVQTDLIQALTYWRTAIGGEYEIQTPHPDAQRQRTVSTSSSDSLYSGTLVVPTDLKIGNLAGSSQISQLLSQVEGVLNLFDAATQTAHGQLDFLQQSVMPVVKRLKGLWSSSNQFGLLSLSFSVDLPLHLKLSLSISFDVKTGTLTLSGGLSVNNSLTDLQGTTLASEGAVIAGGYPRGVDPQIQLRSVTTLISQTSIAQDYPALLSTPVTAPATPLPYQVVSRELNNLNFASQPEQALVSLLVKFGVTKAPQIIAYLVPLLSYGSWFDFLKLAAVLSPPLEKTVITLGLTLNDGFTSPSPSPVSNQGTTTTTTATASDLEDLINFIDPQKVSLQQCPPVPTALTQALTLAQARETAQVNQFLSNYLLTTPPNYSNWLLDQSSFLTWLQTQQHPAYASLHSLYTGAVDDFLLLTVFLETGLDVRAYPGAYQTLTGYLQVLSATPQAGVS